MHVGTVIQGKFRVERVLGKGGMGTVVVATHLQLNQRVALKFLHDELASDAGLVERFLREARSAARLHSDHVCRVSDVGQLETGAPYIVMEMLDGEDLAAVVARRSLDVATATRYVLQACIAIAEAHAAGMVHRDLKPSNLFLAKRVVGGPIVKVLDFGIAKAPASSEFKITRTSMVMGSPGYMSPEQLRSAKDADVRSDVWSLGVILYELVSGRLPFPGESITELTMKVAMDPPVPLAAEPAFARVVMRCLEKPMERRYQTVAELARELAEHGGPDARGLAEAIASFTSLPAMSDERAALAATVPPAFAPAAETQASVAPPPPAAPPRVAVAVPVPVATPTGTTLQGSAGEAQPAARGGRKGLAIAAGLAAIVVIAIVAVVAGGGGGGGGKTARVAKGDDRTPGAAVDGGTVVAAADAAPPPPDAAFDVAALAAKCRERLASRDWPALDGCAHELAAHDPKAGLELEEVAKREVASSVRVSDLDKAIRGNDLVAARRALDAIDGSSVQRVDADKAYAAARDKQIAAAKIHVVSLAGNHACDEIGRYRGGLPADVRSGVPAPPCEAQAAATPPPPKPAGDCETEVIEAHRAKASEAISAQQFAAALSELDAAMKCRPGDGSLLKLAYLAACKSGRFERAKSLFKALANPGLAQICLAQGFDPRE